MIEVIEGSDGPDRQGIIDLYQHVYRDGIAIMTGASVAAGMSPAEADEILRINVVTNAMRICAETIFMQATPFGIEFVAECVTRLCGAILSGIPEDVRPRMVAAVMEAIPDSVNLVVEAGAEMGMQWGMPN